MNFVRFKELKAKIDESNQIGTYVITGGEPLLHPDIDRFIHLCSETSLVKICTNGMLLQRCAKRFAMPLIHELVISMDSYTGAEYLLLRGVAMFDKVDKTIDWCKEVFPQIKLSLSFVIQRQNIHAVNHFVDWAINKNVDSVNLLVPNLDGDFTKTYPNSEYSENLFPKSEQEFQVLESEFEQLSKRIESRPEFFNRTPNELEEIYYYFYQVACSKKPLVRRTPCHLPFFDLTLTPDLKFKPCFFIPHSLSNSSFDQTEHQTFIQQSISSASETYCVSCLEVPLAEQARAGLTKKLPSLGAYQS